MKRAIRLVLITLLLLPTFAGCAQDSGALIGTWEGEANYAEHFIQGLQSIAGEGLSEYWAVEEFYITLILAFREEGTYRMTVDWAKLNQTIENLKKKLTRSLRDFIQDLIDASKATLTVDEFIASMEMDMDTIF